VVRNLKQLGQATETLLRAGKVGAGGSHNRTGMH
jgi:hypothetical protein